MTTVDIHPCVECGEGTKLCIDHAVGIWQCAACQLLSQYRIDHGEHPSKGVSERQRAEAHEREECARLVERFAEAYPKNAPVLRVVALNIRARGKK